MRDFFPRTPADDDEPVDLAQVRADDDLIEALRRTPLFDEPTPAPVSWLRVPGRTADPDDAAVDGVDSDAVDLDAADIAADVAAFARFADTGAVADTPVPGTDDARVAALLQAWRSELDAVPLPPPLDLQVAVAIVRSAPRRRRSVRPMIAVAAAIAGLLLGSTAIGARSATPDNTLLWPVTQLLWGDRADQVLASIDAREGIDKASKALDAGHPDQAEAALDHVTVVITKVQDSSDRRTLQSDLTKVQSQLESSRATAPAPTSVGTTGTVPGGTGTTSNPATPTPSAAATTPSDSPVTSADPATEVGTPAATPSDQPVTSVPESPPVVTTETTPPSTPVTTPDPPTSPDVSTTPPSSEPVATSAPAAAPSPDAVASADGAGPDQVVTG